MPIATAQLVGLVPHLSGARALTLAALRKVSARIESETKFNQRNAFQVGGHQLHGGRVWVPLADSTIALKARLGFSRPAAPLIRTGLMSGLTRVSVQLIALKNGVQFDLVAANAARYSGYHGSQFATIGSFNHWSGTFNPIRHPVEFTRQDLERVKLLISSAMAGVDVVEKGKIRGKKAGIFTRIVSRGRNIGSRILSFLRRRL